VFVRHARPGELEGGGVTARDDVVELPHDADAEAQVVGAMLTGTLGPDVLDTIRTSVNPGDFYSSFHADVFATVTSMIDAGEPVGVTLVANRMRERGLLNGGRRTPLKVRDLATDDLLLAANAPAHAARVRELATRRRAIIAAADLIEKATAGEDWSTAAAVLRGENVPSVAPSHLAFMGVIELLERVEVADTSYLIDPLWPADAYGVIGAMDKAGKTWAVDDLAVSVATGTPWLGRFACEQGGVQLLHGEGGARNLYRRLDAICRARDVHLGDLFGDDVMRIALTVPRLTVREHIDAVAAELAAHPARVVILDPGYLALAGAKGADLFGMGGLLGSIQDVCQRVGAALVVTWHWNKGGEGTGAARFTGVGPGAWGRVLGSAAVAQRHVDGASTVVTLAWEFTGGEIADTEFTMTRRVRVDDPHDLLSPMHYEVEVVDTEPEPGPGEDGLTFTQVRVLAALGAADADEPVTVKGHRRRARARRPRLPVAGADDPEGAQGARRPRPRRRRGGRGRDRSGPLVAPMIPCEPRSHGRSHEPVRTSARPCRGAHGAFARARRSHGPFARGLS
jgi:hypothetical protein